MTEPAKPDRHKRKPFGLRIPDLIRELLEETAAERATTLTQELLRAAREMLEREGKWPTTPRKSPRRKGGES